jgi:hypothetical protein
MAAEKAVAKAREGQRQGWGEEGKGGGGGEGRVVSCSECTWNVSGYVGSKSVNGCKLASEEEPPRTRTLYVY